MEIAQFFLLHICLCKPSWLMKFKIEFFQRGCPAMPCPTSWLPSFPLVNFFLDHRLIAWIPCKESSQVDRYSFNFLGWHPKTLQCHGNVAWSCLNFYNQVLDVKSMNIKQCPNTWPPMHSMPLSASWLLISCFFLLVCLQRFPSTSNLF